MPILEFCFFFCGFQGTALSSRGLIYWRKDTTNEWNVNERFDSKEEISNVSPLNSPKQIVASELRISHIFQGV